MADDLGMLALAWDVEGRSAWCFRSSPSGLQIRNSTDCHGLGVFALHAVQPGERVLAEVPLLQVEDAEEQKLEVEAAVETLKPAARRTYWALCQNVEHGRTKNAYGIWLSNALPTQDEPAAAAVFRVASRFNHSCRPNAHISWNDRTRRITVHALRTIAPDEEVTIHYRGGGDGETRDERRAGLRGDFGFDCACTMCSIPKGASRAASDANQTRIATLFASIAASPTPSNLVHLVEERLEVLAKEGVRTNWDTYGAAMSFLKCTGASSQAARWAARAAASASFALGRDSTEFAQYVAEMAGLESEWLDAGARLRKDGFAILDGFAGESLASALRAQLSVLYAGGGTEFSRGEIGGGSDGKDLDVRKDAAVRGDHRALIETHDPRAPSLGSLFFMMDQFVGMLAARGCVAELRSITRRSRPMLACYAGGGARYVRHVDNPDDNGRTLTAIYYLNKGWRPASGGELVLYPQTAAKTAAYSRRSSEAEEQQVRVEPILDRLVVFWSDHRTPHEVLPANTNRLAISSWYHSR